MNLTTAVKELSALQSELAVTRSTYEAAERRLTAEIAKRQRILNNAEAGLDNEKIALAETVLMIDGQYRPGVGDSDSVIRDAIKQIGTNEPIRHTHGDLRKVWFAVKNYDRWTCQRSDTQYGYCPRHGHLVFAVGMTKDARSRDLTPGETEAAIYYLCNLSRIQQAQQDAA